ALHDKAGGEDQGGRRDGGEDVQPQRRDDQAEGEAGDAGDQRAGKGGEEKNTDVEKRSVHVPAPKQSEQRLHGIAHLTGRLRGPRLGFTTDRLRSKEWRSPGHPYFGRAWWACS